MTDFNFDKAIKFGAGRYLQRPRAISEAGKEIRRFASKIMIISGKTAMEQVKDRLLPSLMKAGIEYRLEIYTGNCTYEAADYYAEIAGVFQAEEIVGIGGGRIMDLVKIVGNRIGKGVINIPTSMATCAAFTGMSIVYDQKGRVVDNLRFEWEVDAVIVDTDVIVNCPARYAKAGILDAMAKKIEMLNGRSKLNYTDAGYDFYSAYRMAEYTYELLRELAPKAIEDIENHVVTQEVEYVIFLSIAMTGILSNATRSYNQSALAHMIYYGVRAYFPEESSSFLHGEIVGIGLFVQLLYNSMEEEYDKLKKYMIQLGMPISLKEVGIDPSEENLIVLEEYLADSRFVEENQNCRTLLHNAMKYL